MENVIESGPGRCACEGGAGRGPTLAVLRDVQRAYEQMMDLVTKSGGSNKLQKQVDVLRSWVSDLVEQNTLLARTVEELETEVTSRLLLERRRHLEREKNKKACDKVNEMKMVNDSLKMENVSKDREIRRLNKDMQQYEQTIMALRRELSGSKYHTPDVSKRDAEVIADICCAGMREQCQDVPVKECGALTRKGSGMYQEPMQQMESGGDSVRTLRQVNVALREEVHAMQRVCAALDEQCHVGALRAQFRDEIIHEMRKQLKKAKAKLKEVSGSNSIKLREGDSEVDRKASGSYESLTISCVQQQQPRRKRKPRPEFGMVTSTPNRSHDEIHLDDSDVSIVKKTPSPPLLITNSSINSDLVCKCDSHFISSYPIQKREIEIKKSIETKVDNDEMLSDPIPIVKMGRRMKDEGVECECGIIDDQSEVESTGAVSPVVKIEPTVVNVRESPLQIAGQVECDCGAKETIIDDSKTIDYQGMPSIANTSIVNAKKSPILSEETECDCEESENIDQETGILKATSPNITADASMADVMGSIIKISKVRECECADTTTMLTDGETSNVAKSIVITGSSNVNDKRSTLKLTGAMKCDYGGRSLAQIVKRMDKNNLKERQLFQSNITVNGAEKKEKRTKDPEIITLNDSVRAPSLAESSASEAARALSLENKLMATMQILKNKEETVRVQAESLALAEARIAALASKAQQTSSKLHQTQQTHPLFSVRSSADGCHLDMTDVSASADLQDGDNKIVSTLRDNLSVIEELYRECFYESAKQEEMITMLRRSYLDMRLMERQKTEQIGRLQGVVHSQRCSLERCQDIALEVENLKSEISNFLNSSQNNDSGMWEREDGATDVTEELRGISDQLRRLRDLLNTDCTCGLEEENMKLKRINDKMEIQISELRQRVSVLEEALENKENMDERFQLQIREKEQELQHIRNQLFTLEEESRGQSITSDALNIKLEQLEVLLNDKASELLNVQQHCEAQEVTIKHLRDQLDTADSIARDNGSVRCEVSQLSAQVAQWRDQLADSRRRLRALEEELQRARDQCRHLAEHYREKSRLAAALQDQLQEAQGRGAVLCAEARRAVCAVRRWLRDHRQKNREQQDKIKQQEIIIDSLRRGSAKSVHTSASDEPCCSKYLTPVGERRSDRSFVGSSEMGSCTKCPSSGRINTRTSESEMASSPTPPTPPRRLLRKKPLCGDVRCQWAGARSCGVQRPHRSDACVDARLSREQLPPYPTTFTREVSPTDELLERVERAHEALADAHRRWGRHCGLAGCRPASREGDT